MSITAGELAQARADMTRTLPASCLIERVVSRVSNESGGWIDTYGPLATVACRVGPLSGREAVVAGRLATVSDLVVTLPALTDVANDDRIVEFDAVYEVVHVAVRSEELVRRVFVTKVS